MFSDILVPNPLDSDQQYNRFHHYDLADMKTEDLLDELHAIRSRLWFLKSDRFAHMVNPVEQRRRVEWLHERISRIEAELRERRYTIREVKSQPKPKLKLAEGVRL